MNEGNNPNQGGNPNWIKGGPSPNPGGKPRKLVEIEKMLDEEFRDVASTRENYRVLRKLALQGAENEMFTPTGAPYTKTTFHPAYMEQLFNRLYGPIREVPVDLTDATDEFLAELRARVKPS
jgi:hypothetical protein